MPSLFLPTLACAVALAMVHLLTPRLTFLGMMPRSRWLSFAGGVAVAYVFLHLIPDLAEHEAEITHEYGLVSSTVYIVALIGLAAFYGLERLVTADRDDVDTPEGGGHSNGVFWLHVASFAGFNLLIGYLLHSRENDSMGALLLYTGAMLLHFLTNDFGMYQDHGKAYRRSARWLLAGATMGGWLLGWLLELPEQAIIILFSFLAGGVILNVLKEELPQERQSQFLPFLIGAISYGALSLAG